MRPGPPAPTCAPDGHCVTCSDEGVPMRVVALEDDGLATCRGEAGAESSVDLGLVSPVAVGDAVLVHAGVALTVLSAPARGVPA